MLSSLHKKWFSPWARKNEAAELTERIRRKRPESPHAVDPDIFSIPWSKVDSWRNVSYQYTTEDEEAEEFERRYENDNSEYGQFPIWLALWNVVASFVVRMFLSHDGLEVAVPYWLFFAAAYVCINKAGWIERILSLVGRISF